MIGNSEELGKAVGVDAAKNTFVKLYGLPKCEEMVQKYTAYSINGLKAFDDSDFMQDLAEELVSRTK